MPPVKSLHKQQAEKAAPQAVPPDAPQALATFAPDAGIGEVLAQFEAPTHAQIEPQNAPPYVGFVSDRSQTYPTLKGLFPDLALTDCFLGIAGNFKLLRPFKFMLLKYEQFFSNLDDQNNVIACSRSYNGEPDLTDDILAAVLVFHEGGVVPARTSFRRGRSPAVYSAIAAYKYAEKPEWFKLSPAHEATANIRYPFGRFTTSVSISMRTSRKGRKYQNAVGFAKPTTMEEATQLKDAMADPSFLKLLKMVLSAHDERTAEYTSKITQLAVA